MFELPKLDYSYDALEPYIDKATMEIHYNKHHRAYTNNLNDAIKDHPDMQKMSIEDILKSVSVIPEDIKNKIINNGGGYYNHNLYWKFMSPIKSTPGGKLLTNLNDSFGSLDVFKEKFFNSALNHFGSGWAWLVLNKKSLEILSTFNQNSPISDGKEPILGIDIWEHAYYLKYQNNRSDYIKAWWNVVNWEYVTALFEKSI